MMDYDRHFDPPDDGPGICPLCHCDIESHDRTDDGDGYLCAEDVVPDDAVLWGSDADSALRDDADDYRLSQAGL